MEKINCFKKYFFSIGIGLFLLLTPRLVFCAEPLNPAVEEESVLFKNVKHLRLIDFSGKEFDVLLFLPIGYQEHGAAAGTLLSLGYYTLPINAGLLPHSYLWQVGRWFPRIADILEQGQPVIVPDTEFSGSHRADALWACAQYLQNELNVLNIFMASGSAGGRGALELLEEPKYKVSISGFFPINSNWNEGQLAKEKIYKIESNTVIFYAAGDEDLNSQVNGLRLFEAIDRFNPDIKMDLKIYGPNAGHDFFTEENEASEAAKTDIYLIMDSIIHKEPLPQWFDEKPDKPDFSNFANSIGIEKPVHSK